MVYVAIAFGLAVTLGMILLAMGLGLAAKEGDRKLREYHEARGRFYGGDNE